MDFGQTLLAAQKNQKGKSSDGLYYRSKFEPPKKEQRQKNQLSMNIQKFLAKKEEEERQKQLELKRKRDELLAKRDPKANKKIQKMLKVIKSANKSVLAEAVDHHNTAVTLEGPYQPDQDDYGYESKEASAIYEKMMQKYSKLPEEEKFPTRKGIVPRKDMEDTKERVKNALKAEDEPHKRQRRPKDHHDRNHSPSPQPEEEKKPDKPKLKRPAPPPLDFNELLKLAEQKKSEPILIPVKKQDPESEVRPMTKKEKREYEEEKARREAQERRLKEAQRKPANGTRTEKPKEPVKSKPEVSTSAFTRIPKLSDRNQPSSSKNIKANSLPIKSDKAFSNRDNIKNINNSTSMNKNYDKPSQSKVSIEKKLESKYDHRISEKSKREEIREIPNDRRKNDQSIKINKIADSKNIDRSKIIQKDHRLRTVPSKEGRSVELKKPPIKDIKYNDVRKEVKPSNNNSIDGRQTSNTVKSSSGTFDFDKHMSTINKSAPPLKNSRADLGKKVSQLKKPKKRVIDSESEYDSEMDDFIDDGDAEVDYSKHIRDIFGYDKSKYRMDDEDDCMESTFAQQMREEYISKREGIREDLEDIRKEKMEKMMKAKKRRLLTDDY